MNLHIELIMGISIADQSRPMNWYLPFAPINLMRLSLKGNALTQLPMVAQTQLLVIMVLK